MPRRKLLRQLKAAHREIPQELALTDIRLRSKAGARRKPGIYTGGKNRPGRATKPIPEVYQHFYDPYSPFKFIEEE